VEARQSWTPEQKVTSQEILGISVDYHPLDLFADQVRAANATAPWLPRSRLQKCCGLPE
jgi:hypothetical protein